MLPSPWKIQERKKRKIIWAPHHSMDNSNETDQSTFLKYFDFMIWMAERYYNEIQIAFKPHPYLKNMLQKRWGIDKVNEYYNRWNTMGNTQLFDDDNYVALFQHSDALIHDCGSFIIEYQYFCKPALFLEKRDSFHRKLNSYVRKAYELHYQAWSEKDIIEFVENIIKGHDSLSRKRCDYYQYLKTMNKGNASENIINSILEGVDNK
jgi:CDP-glycerol glycerophosphotransferase (TagB/SpsB family)